MLRGVFITLLLAAVAHNTLADGGDDKGKDRPKFPCCPPRKFEANVINMDMDIDTDEIMYTVNVSDSDSTKHTCKKMNIDSSLYRSCFGSRVNIDSSRFTYIGESTMGRADTGVKFDAWMISETEGIVKSRIAMTRDDCLPLVESTEGVYKGRRFFRKMLYTQASLSITKPEMLTLPPACM